MNFTIDRMQRRLVGKPGAIPLAGGLPAESTFPRAALAKALARALRHDAGALQYDWPEGRPKLRAWVAERLTRSGARVGADEVIVCSGAQQALAISSQVALAAGDAIAVAQSTYPAALDLFRAQGLLPDSASSRRVRAVYTMPAIGNPSGRALNRAERMGVLHAGGGKAELFEDDAYADLRFDSSVTPPLRTTARPRAWHIGSFSKTLCPGLRVGWLVPPPSRYKEALRVKQALDLQANSLAQAILEQFLATCDFEARLERLRRFYARRAERLAEAVRRHLPSFRFTFPEGGFALWLESDHPGDDAAFLAAAVRRKTSFDPGSEFRARGGASPIALRLSYSSAPFSRLEEGVMRLAMAWRDYVAA